MKRIKAAVLAWALCVTPAWAAKISQFTPQGTVAKIESVKIAFDADVSAFGDAQAPAPVDVVCNDPEVQGQGRWLDARRWAYVFDSTLAPGVSCTVAVRPEFRTLTNESVAGKTSYRFQTGGPAIVETQPYGNTIAEDQVFVLRFNGDVDADSLLAHARCLVDGLGEAVRTRLVDGDARTSILDVVYSGREASMDTAAVQLLQCKRRLPAEARVRLSIGAGVATIAGNRPVMASSAAKVFGYKVRPAFKATFTCQRENSSMPCTPVSALSVSFSAPIARADAGKMRLKSATQEWLPAISDNDSYQGGLSHVSFDGPFPELASLTLYVPDGLKDDAGRALLNADQFPLAIRTAAFPPLVKFSAAPFGIVERFTNAPGTQGDVSGASVPLTLRNVESSLGTKDLAVSAGKVSDYTPKDDLEVLRWYARVRRLDEGRWTASQLVDIMADRPPRSEDRPRVDTRGFSALKNQRDARKLVLPGVNAGNPRPFEVIGIPIDPPGFHVLEVESARLGQSLLESEGPMYVRTAALITNLGVHVKTGRDDMLAWVTTLDDGQVVPEAAITVLDCSGKVLAQGMTDANGIWHHRQALDAPRYCDDTGLGGTYVSARIAADHPMAHGAADFSFVFSDWNEGIESWRFNVPTDTSPKPTVVTHTVFDRTLLRAGETVSMKHFIRTQTRDGLALPTASLPDKLIVEHEGTGRQYTQTLSWQQTASGGLFATSTLAIPKTAELGVYAARLTDPDSSWYGSSRFRVEEFKLPLLTGQLKISNGAASDIVIAPKTLSADVQLSYVSGGPAGKLPLHISGVLKDRVVDFPNYDDYSFSAPEEMDEDHANEQSAAEQSLFLDKQAMVLDAHGGGRLEIASLPSVTQAQTMVLEATFADPNGEIQTLAQSVPVWPAAVQAGIRAGNWVQAGKPTQVSSVALTPSGKPQADIAMTVRAVARNTYSTRKRMVGGFYSYDNRVEVRQLGTVCEGKTNAQGRLDCAIQLNEGGSIQLIATVKDATGLESRAATTIWVTGADDLWFGGDNDDRIDIIPARKSWAPGETAQFQVRMPFRHATALVAVEREGVLQTQVVRLEGNDPTIRIPVEAEWGPNVYVSVLALRGRLHDVPWQSFFTWGWQQPGSWYKAFMRAGEPAPTPTAFIDLAKPSFRFGLTEIRVSDSRDQVQVKVSADKQRYQLREKAKVAIEVTLPDGKPAAHGTVAFAAVDQALLELASNDSWDLLSAMRQFRSYGVETATAQSEIVGRRHYGRKALPAGGGGGASPTRELLDTLLLWQSDVQLDAQGRAQVTVPLNDSITRFKLVAIADYGAERFGTGSTSIASSQDLQIISGLPAVIREGDNYQAMATVRNSTQRSMRLDVSAAYAGTGVPAERLASQAIELAPGAASTVTWNVQAPESNALNQQGVLDWRFEAREQSGGAADALAFRQALIPVVPVKTRQATLLRLVSEQPAVSLPVSVPKGAQTDRNGMPRGGLQVQVQSSLAGPLPGVQEWFADYPYTCLEQQSSRAIGMNDVSAWRDIMHRLPDYLDDDGLVAYFPGGHAGNEVLTAYLLVAAHEAQSLGLPYALPEASRQAMARGLLAFVQGKLVRRRWAPRNDLDVRKLAALEALSRYGLAKPRMLDSIAIDPNGWPTSALIDWMAILQRVPGIAQQSARLDQVGDIIRARLSVRGTTSVFAEDEQSNWWWLMVSAETNLAKLILTGAGQPAWDAEMPQLARGLLSLQAKGAWQTTTANLLGTLALQKFARHYERTPVEGHVQVSLASGGEVQTFQWAGSTPASKVQAHEFWQPWPSTKADTLILTQQGQGTPWATIRSQAAVPATQAVMSGYDVARRIKPVSQAIPGIWSRGDVYRVTLDIKARAPTTWAVLTDPLPAGATILGSGLGRDSTIATQAEADTGWRGPSFVERSFESYRAYYEYLPAGATSIEYTVRLNTVGQFQLPPTRIEAMYQPDVFGELPNRKPVVVRPAEMD
ncbi:alpha-2-macroglobulin family protein [Pollutimonas subterranea]|uniref:alpha-2-macroglobulin family protein n=1 Tax=Pollutimonas subterranea TaxID=2045210 RepID=UPI001E639210|nr:MG2 domain-containing protein [Pollutimonas subterranea]